MPPSFTQSEIFMTRSLTRSLIGSLVATCCLLAGSANAGPKEDVTKPLKALINSVRYEKDLLALKNLSGEEQGKFLVGEQWAKGTEAQKKEFITLFHTLFAKIAFPKIRENFKNLDTVLYEEPTVEGDRAKVGSTILINHPLKKQELKVKYDLLKEKGGYKVIDVAVLGDSMLKGIQEDQVQPILKEGGWDKLLDLMRTKTKELEGQKLK
jgi:phospholipid transport system substrate-binding protein